ncbi:MAG: DUF6527 family protein [Candidatus Dormibacteria bacterium]
MGRRRIIPGEGEHIIQVIPDSSGRVVLVWEHNTLPGYIGPNAQPCARHQVSATGPHWTVVSDEPLTLTPSVHCDRNLGGCGMHGFVTAGRWI